MRELIDASNVDAPSAEYPKGRVRDKIGATIGTTYNEVLHGDLFQAFHRFVTLSGTSENGLPDNVSNDYQLVEAIRASIMKRASTTVLNNGAITTSVIDVATFVPNADYDFTDMKVDFSCRVSHKVVGAATGLVFRINVNGVDEYSTSMTIFADGRNEMVNFSAAGIAYSKGDIVKITAQMSADTCTIGVPSLIVEGLNS